MLSAAFVACGAALISERTDESHSEAIEVTMQSRTDAWQRDQSRN